jgi:hypothetical protein
MMDWWEIQERIAAEDPQGKPFPPTEAAEQAFRAWVLKTYGKSIYDRYFRG